MEEKIRHEFQQKLEIQQRLELEIDDRRKQERMKALENVSIEVMIFCDDFEISGENN